MERSNWRAIETNIGGRQVELYIGNVGLAFFRLEQEKDYLDYREPKEVPDGEEPQDDIWWVFRHRQLMLWMHGAPVLEGDQEIIDEMTEANGDFTDYSGGWRPKAFIEDEASEWETEMYTQSLLKDLNSSDGLPDDFIGA